MTISSLGYVGFNVSDQEAWHDFATKFLGLMPAANDGPTKKYTMDTHSWRIATEKGDKDDIAFVGFEATSRQALEQLQNTLKEGDIAFQYGSAALCKEREVRELVVFEDPAGLQVEVFVGPTVRPDKPFVSPAGVSGFRTGDQGVGHVVLASANVADVSQFYRSILGFRVSDTIDMTVAPNVTIPLEFLHCNPRHHTIALAPGGGPKRLHHFMIETLDLDDVGYALDRVKSCGIKQATTLGKHSNDYMVSFYSYTPSGFEVEFGWGGREVDDDTWQVAHLDIPSIWGHKPIPT